MCGVVSDGCDGWGRVGIGGVEVVSCVVGCMVGVVVVRG